MPTHSLLHGPNIMDIKLDTISFSAEHMRLTFHDGGICDVPLAAFPRLLNASASQRQDWKIIGNSRGIHWPQIDEDLSLPRLLQDFAAPIAPATHSTGGITSGHPFPTAH